MAPPSWSMAFLIANGIFLFVYLLLVSERFPKVIVTLSGAVLLILTGIVSQEEALHAIDFNVISLLLGMMIMVNILKQTGGFEVYGLKLARALATKVQGTHSEKHLLAILFVVLNILTAVGSALLDNVTMVMLMGSVTLALAKPLRLPVIPFVLAQVLCSNVGGSATLIGDPPNIMIGSAAKLDFMTFLLHVAPCIVFTLPWVILFLVWVFRKNLWENASGVALVDTLEGMHPEQAWKQPRLWQQGVWVLGCVLLGMSLHHVIHQEVGTLALAGAVWMLCLQKPENIWQDIEWDTLFFFIGLFILVGALEKVGTLHLLASGLTGLTQGDVSFLKQVLLWGSALCSALVDNIPYTATMIPLLKEVTLALPSVQQTYVAQTHVLWWSLALGVCLGGNATLIGATANVVGAEMLRHQADVHLGFKDFLRIGLPTTLLTLVLASLYLAIRYP
ncbi:MAG: SLC13 family permease [Vampirovibrionales bacterium]